MPSYFYHIKFELYPSPNHKISSPVASSANDIWLPPTNFDIFSELPSHAHRYRHCRVSSPAQHDLSVYDSIPTLPPLSSSPLPLSPTTPLIDCGTTRGTLHDDARNSNFIIPPKHQLWKRSETSPPPFASTGIGPHVAFKDWRFNRLSIESFDAVRELPAAGPQVTNMAQDPGPLAGRRPAPEVGPNMGQLGTRTMARFVPLGVNNTEIGWGVVHLYREGDESPELDYAEHDDQDELDETQCTSLCIPAIPSSLGITGFLNFVGPDWLPHVAHWRLVMTNDSSAYLVLLKFRDGKKAKLFRDNFNGQVFSELGNGACHVLYARSITFEAPRNPSQGSFPDLTHDPFVPPSLKPFPPPTPSLTELPTCPVCLERMDDTSGLVTIPCQHVFHCMCLRNWKGSGCPVCRYTNNSRGTAAASSPSYEASNPYAQPFGRDAYNLCTICDCPDDLWICLICGHVGCGRYKRGHAKDHWKETAHCFALELETQHVWDYAGDVWVHRLIREKGDGKVMELPNRPSGSGDDSRNENDDSVPRSKLDTIGIEYTHLLTSQLESQRIYFEEMLNKAVDKASLASAVAEQAKEEAITTRKEMSKLKKEQERLISDVIPQLEKDVGRERKRAEKASELARNLTKKLSEEREVTGGLMKRVAHSSKELEALKEQVVQLSAEKVEMAEMNRDLTMFISGQEKLKELESSGQVGQGEVREGTVSAPKEESSSSRGGRRRRRGGNRSG